jgi:hypothetical protein
MDAFNKKAIGYSNYCISESWDGKTLACDAPAHAAVYIHQPPRVDCTNVPSGSRIKALLLKGTYT